MLTGNRLLFLILLLGYFLIISCKGGLSGDLQKGGYIAFEQQNFSRRLENCTIDATPCAAVAASYPHAAAGSVEACKNINDTIDFQVRFSLALFAVTKEEVPKDLEGVAEQLFTEYKETLKNQPNYQIPWRAETKGKILFQSPKVVAVQLDNYAYSGGAHPNTHTSLFNFDNSTGQRINIDDLVTDRKELERIAESAFRKTHKIQASESIKTSGFFWGSPFRLPDNFAVLEKGLYFFYNAYEVAAYAAGSTDFTVPYQELEQILVKDRIF